MNADIIKTNFYCPHCGARTVGCRAGQCGGDYYAGVTYTCSTCDYEFNLPCEEDPNEFGVN